MSLEEAHACIGGMPLGLWKLVDYVGWGFARSGTLPPGIYRQEGHGSGIWFSCVVMITKSALYDIHLYPDNLVASIDGIQCGNLNVTTPNMSQSPNYFLIPPEVVRIFRLE
jgi:hypothetical protein